MDNSVDKSGVGIIPARAGFTLVGRFPLPAQSDHPRSRGVYVSVAMCCVVRLGSSPLARGLHELMSLVKGGGRIIPARAGFTRRTATATRTARDHPRSRGVYLVPIGLSAVRGRIIPARAGFTDAVSV